MKINERQRRISRIKTIFEFRNFNNLWNKINRSLIRSSFSVHQKLTIEEEKVQTGVYQQMHFLLLSMDHYADQIDDIARTKKGLLPVDKTDEWDIWDYSMTAY